MWLVVVPLLIAIITFTGLIYLRLEEQGRSISDIFSDNQQVAPAPEPIIVVEEVPEETQEAEEEEEVEEVEEEEEEPAPIQVDPDTGMRLYPELYDGTTSINLSSPILSLKGSDKDILEIKWIDYDGHISWTGAPDERFDVEAYVVEFASASENWVWKFIQDCEKTETIPISFVTTCTIELEQMKWSPLFLTDDDIVRARVWAIDRSTGLRAPSDGWDCKPEDGNGSLVFIGQAAVYNGEINENCLPKEGGEARIITRKNYVFEGKTEDNGNSRIGKYILTDDTAIAGTFTGDGLNGWYTVTYPSGLSCTETWSDG